MLKMFNKLPYHNCLLLFILLMEEKRYVLLKGSQKIILNLTSSYYRQFELT